MLHPAPAIPRHHQPHRRLQLCPKYLAIRHPAVRAHLVCAPAATTPVDVKPRGQIHKNRATWDWHLEAGARTYSIMPALWQSSRAERQPDAQSHVLIPDAHTLIGHQQHGEDVLGADDTPGKTQRKTMKKALLSLLDTISTKWRALLRSRRKKR